MESDEGKGSAFHFTAILGVGKVTELPQARPPVAPANSCVLVVDDNATNRRILQEMLSDWGMRPVLAETGTLALDCVNRPMIRFGLILTDFNLPDMDGFTLVRRLRQSAVRTRGSKVIMMSPDLGSVGTPRAPGCRALMLTSPNPLANRRCLTLSSTFWAHRSLKPSRFRRSPLTPSRKNREGSESCWPRIIWSTKGSSRAFWKGGGILLL